MRSPTISIVVPTFNRIATLGRALESIFSQTFGNYEVIVVDDGSTDGTAEYIKDKWSAVRYVWQENRGPAAARNTGIVAAKGSWIAFLDSDDAWEPGYLAEQVKKVNENKQGVFHMTNLVFEDSNEQQIDYYRWCGLDKLFSKRNSITIAYPLKLITRYHLTWLPSTIILREAVLRAGMFNESLWIAEDTDLLMRVALMGTLVISKEALVRVYRAGQGCGNLSECGVMKTSEALISVYKSIMSNYSLRWKDRRMLRRELSKQHRGLGNYLVMRGDRSAALEEFKNALKAEKIPWNFLKCVLCVVSMQASKWIIERRQHLKERRSESGASRQGGF